MLLPPTEPATPTPSRHITVDRTKKFPACERGECAQCPEAEQTRTPVIVVRNNEPRRVAEDIRVTLCTCACHCA